MRKEFFEDLTLQDRLACFYLLPKVHKTPWQTRPVISQSGTLLEPHSKWLDFKLQEVKNLCPAYLKDSWELLKEIQLLSPFPRSTQIVTADAVAMYVNIDVDHGLSTLWKSRNFISWTFLWTILQQK